MKVVKDLTEFYLLNDKDLEKILLRYFSNVLKYYDIEDIKSQIYERLLKKNYVQNFRPLEIHIDSEDRTWEIIPSHAKFSTYICKLVFYYMYAYYDKIKPDDQHESLEDFNDSNFNEEDNKSLHPLENKDDYNPTSNLELNMEIEKVLLSLEKKTKHKGTLICDSNIDANIAKAIDSYGKKGCKEEVILEIALSRKVKRSELTKLEVFLFDKHIEKIEKSGIIRAELDEKGNKRYFLNNPERRSLYNLFKYYMEGYRDKEISEKFKMTVAGVGAMKRSLRKEIRDLEHY